MPTRVTQGIGTKLTAAEKYAQQYVAHQVKQVTKETKDAIRAAVVRSFRENAPPFDAARAIRAMVGMTTQQMQGALNYRDTLINSGLKLSQVDAKVARYVQRKINARATTIARTETMRALNGGVMEESRASVKAGHLGKRTAKKWHATPDNRICPICESLDGTSVPLDEDFPGGYDAPPAHPLCRCSISMLPDDIVDSMAGKYIAKGYKIINPDGIDTMQRFGGSFANMPAKRLELNERVLAKWLKGHDTQLQPHLRMLGGGPGSGKSSLAKLKLTDPPPADHVLVNVDLFRPSYPEYRLAQAAKDPSAAAFTHNEVSEVGSVMRARAAQARYNVVYDGTGDGTIDELVERLDIFRKQGYMIEAQYVTVDVESGIARSIARSLNPKSDSYLRSVPEKYQRATYKKISKTVQKALDRGLFDDFSLWDNNGKPPPFLVARAQGKTFTLGDDPRAKAAWARFVAAGK